MEDRIIKHRAIELADPLEANEIISSLPDINQQQNINELSKLLSVLLDRLDKHTPLNEIEACAAMRDIGFVMSSMRKLGVQPANANNSLTGQLLKLGEITRMVPRDTVYHYSVWNPEGQHQRLFTHFEDEKSLIKSVRHAITDLENALQLLAKAISAGITAPGFAAFCTDAEVCLKDSISSLAIAIRNVHPRIFSVELRPFFDPVEINGKSYIASGGGQIPLFLVDKIVWLEEGKNEQEDAYLKFVLHSFNYLPHSLNQSLKGILNGPALTGMIKAALQKSEKIPAENMIAVADLIKRLISFREAHQKYAAKSFTDENIGNYKTGSAGYEMSFVHYLLNLTRNALSKIETAAKV